MTDPRQGSASSSSSSSARRKVPEAHGSEIPPERYNGLRTGLSARGNHARRRRRWPSALTRDPAPGAGNAGRLPAGASPCGRPMQLEPTAPGRCTPGDQRQAFGSGPPPEGSGRQWPIGVSGGAIVRWREKRPAGSGSTIGRRDSQSSCSSCSRRIGRQRPRPGVRGRDRDLPGRRDRRRRRISDVMSTARKIGA